MHLPIAISLLATLAVAADPAADPPDLRAEIRTAIEAMPSGTTSGPAQVPWRLWAPATASAQRPLPLVVLLHGAGSRGRDNLKPMNLAWPFVRAEAQARHACFVLTPQMRTCWVGQPHNKGSYDSAAIPLSPELSETLDLVDATIASHPIDRRRVYIVGMSMGGYGAWDALIRRPDLWAAGLPICGAGDPGKAAAIRDIPVWPWHGTNDTAVPVSGSRDMVEALRASGARPRYTELPTGGHGVWVPALASAEVMDWLFAQARPAAP